MLILRVVKGKLLNESLAEHRKELKKQAMNLLAPGKFNGGRKGLFANV